MGKILQLKNKGKETGRFEIKNQSDNKAELLIYGDIVSGEWDKWENTDVAPTDIRNFLDQVKGKDLDIYINSGGGSVFAGMGIYNMLKRHEGTKNVYVDGLAASIASVIAMAGDNIYIPSNAFLMIHKAWNFTYGNADELRKTADTLDMIDQGILNVYQEKMKECVDIETIKQMVAAETWLTGDEAEKYFNINVIEENNVVACCGDISKYKNAPKLLIKDKQKNEDKNDTNLDTLKAKLALQLL